MYIFYPEAKTDFHKNKVKIKSYKNLKVNENGKKSNSLTYPLLGQKLHQTNASQYSNERQELV